tara:strand:- start:30 stop:329 length:300 start_codon:yes stop_codon:yes gene_type:complete
MNFEELSDSRKGFYKSLKKNNIKLATLYLNDFIEKISKFSIDNDVSLDTLSNCFALQDDSTGIKVYIEIFSDYYYFINELNILLFFLEIEQITKQTIEE